jgi:hypothetical protein
MRNVTWNPVTTITAAAVVIRAYRIRDEATSEQSADDAALEPRAETSAGEAQSVELVFWESIGIYYERAASRVRRGMRISELANMMPRWVPTSGDCQ